MPKHPLNLISAIVAALLLLVAVPTATRAAPRQDATLLNATQVLTELRNAPDQNVPNWLLERAYAVAVIPNVIKVSLIGGVRRGSGVMVVRQPDTTWSNPVFVNLTGGSLGLQWGVQSSDIMLVFVTKASVEGIFGGKVTFGADASVAAGPVGRQTSAATDFNLNAQVYAYSRSKGLFLGVSLDGSALTIANKDNEEFYGKQGALASDIMAVNAPHAPASAHPFLQALGPASPATATGSASNPSPPTASITPTAPQAAPSTQTPDNRGSGLVTYPMEDSNPGSQPPP